MYADLYIMRFHTNLHAGAMGDGFSIVDKQVQRDPASELPTIHASSLKGALRAFAESAQLPRDQVEGIFGQELPKNGTPKQGSARFLPAQLLLYPLRTSTRPYLLGTCPSMLNTLLEYAAIGGIEGGIVEAAKRALQNAPKQGTALLLAANGVTVSAMSVETLTVEKGSDASLAPLCAGPLLLLHDEDMSALCKELPILARNCLENGLSGNLWYEEVVPRESVFCSLVLGEKREDMQVLRKTLCAPNTYVQIGANATLGYGLCSMQVYAREGGQIHG